MTVFQCLIHNGWYCPADATKQPVIYKQGIVGIFEPCSVVSIGSDDDDPTDPVDPFEILTFVGGFPATGDAGSGPLVEPSFTATYSEPPSTVVLKNDAGFADEVIPSPAISFQSAHTYPDTAGKITWTLCADGEETTYCTEFVTPAFSCTQYIAVVTGPGPYTEADILTGASELVILTTSDGTFCEILNPAGEDEYVVHVWCSALEAVTGPRDGAEHYTAGFGIGGFDRQPGGLLIGGVQHELMRTNVDQNGTSEYKGLPV